MPKIKYPYEFDSKKRKIAKNYRRGRLLIYFISLLVSSGAALIILFSNLHTIIRDFAIQYPFSVQFYGFLILLIFTVLSFPFIFYSTFVYEKKFKLSNYTVIGWFKDYLKNDLIGFIFALILISLLYFSIRTFSLWWLYASVFYIIFYAIINYVYPLIIVPFMWKTEPYKDKKMKEKILNLCRKLGVLNIRNVLIAKESEKSVRPNAYFYGIGNQQKIALFDNLLNNFTKDEIETVVGHELGHYVNKDIIRGLILESILIFPILFGVDYFIGILSPFFGVNGITDLAALPLFGLIYGTLGFLSMPITNAHSRWRESEADRFALIHVRKPLPQLSTEKRLADLHLSELKPYPLVEFWLFTHPSTIRRIKMAQEWKIRTKK